MKQIMNQQCFLSLFYSIPFDQIIIFCLFFTFTLIKIFLLNVAYVNRNKAANQTLLFLSSISIISYLLGELAIFISIFYGGFVGRTIWRFAWNIQPIQFYSQILFVKNLVQQKYVMNSSEKNFFAVLFLLIFFPLILLFINPNEDNFVVFLFSSIFCKAGIVKRTFIKGFGYFVLLLTIHSSWKSISMFSDIPHFLKLQLKKFFILMFLPVLPDTLTTINIIFDLHDYFTFNVVRLLDLFSVASFTISLVYFARRIYNLRFLNMTGRVIAGPVSQLTDEQMLDIKQTLCDAKNISELSAIHIDFFKRLANIAPERIMFHVHHSGEQIETNKVIKRIEQFIQEKPTIAAQFFVEDSLLVYDELAFTHFYEYSDERAEILQLLQEINAAVMIPLKHMDQLFGAIIITKDSKKEELFSKSVQLHMQLYGTFVVYALSRLEHVSYYTLLEKNKAQSLMLFESNQKNARFHETVMSFLKSDATKKHGVLLYKTNVFSCMNQIAQELLQINPNIHQGHPLVKTLKELVRRVQTYGGSQNMIEKNNAGIDLCFQVFSLKKEELFILISPANVAHLLSIEQALLQPTEIDHAVFLYTTPEGHAVNHALPGKGTVMHRSKLQLLKILLSKKAMVFDVHEDDIDMMLEIAKKVCHKTIVQTIDCLTMSSDEVATALFGTQLFGNTSTKKIEHGLLYALDESGIIHIANAHRLESKAQELLLRFLKTGSFCLYKTEIRQTSDVTIMFSSPVDLVELTKNNLFSKELYEYIKDAVVAVPNLLRLPFVEVETMARELQKQLITQPEYYHLFGFSPSELEQLHSNRPESYTQLRRRIAMLTKQRKAQALVLQETAIQNVTIDQHDELLLDAARRGKQVLKDRKTMRALWERFKNQTRIAELLDVDRSSVYRRLKAYGLVVSAE